MEINIDKEFFEWLKDAIKTLGKREVWIDELLERDERDETNIRKLFPTFSRLLRYARLHGQSSKIQEEEIDIIYGDSYLCFDSSIALNINDAIINMTVVELGGCSDMIIRNITNEFINKVDIIEMDDFINWSEDAISKKVNCYNCENLEIISVEYKVDGKDYLCSQFGELSYKNYGLFYKNENHIHPCPSCRRSEHIKYTERK